MRDSRQKQVLFSGIQPSGIIHIGNYLGAIKNWVNLQNQYRAIFCIVDEHAITSSYKSEELKKNVLDAAALYLSCGINPEETIIFIQSQVPEHTELAWILNTMTPLGELLQMTQFKEKAGLFRKEAGKRNLLSLAIDEGGDLSALENMKLGFAGLLNYPVLMAADILLYKTSLVPVGEDQKQHIELTKSLANRFNRRYGKTFVIPEIYLTPETKRIMGLDNPLNKMSKSASSPYNYIGLLDEPDLIRDKIKKAVTDSGKEVKYNLKDKPAISNLLNIMSGITGLKILELEKKYAGASYADFKNELTKKLVAFLAPIQEKYGEFQKNQKKILGILKSGREEAKKIANETMKEAKEKIGFLI